MRIPFITTGLVLATMIMAQPGALDPTFGNGGFIQLDPGAGTDMFNDGAYGVASLADDRVLVTGYSMVDGEFLGVVLRLNADGSLDEGFGENGIRFIQAGTITTGFDLAVLGDGSIMVAGYSYASFGQSDVMLAKLTSEGSLDTGFGTNGIVLTSIGAGLDLGYAVSIQPDGRMVVCGSSADANGVDNGLVLRFNEDGALDNSFSGDGYAVITAWQEADRLWDLALLPDGSIVAAGMRGTNEDMKTMLVKFDSNGVPDASFGSNGVLIPDLLGTKDGAYGAVPSGDGFLVCGKCGEDLDAPDAFVARFNGDGTIDTGFNGTGMAFMNAVDTSVARDVILQSDGRILVCGTTGPELSNDPRDLLLGRFLSDGTPDNSFGTDGVVITDLGDGFTDAQAMALRADGRILVAGITMGNDNDIVVARYLADACAVFPNVSPEGLVLCPNATGDLSTEAFDSYQWYKNGAEIPGATGQALTLTSADDVGSWFMVRTTIDTCFGFSDSVLVDGYTFLPPSITNTGDAPNLIGDNSEQIYCQGDDPVLVLGAPYDTNVQWSVNGEPIPGANDTLYAVPGSGSYTVEGAPSVCPDFIQDAVTIEMDFHPYVQPTIYQSGILLCPQPEGLSSQWYYNGQPVAGFEQCVIPIDAGNYTVFVDYGDSCSVLSAPFYLVGLDEYELADMKASPVPTPDRVTITWADGGPIRDWRVIDVTGRIVRSGTKATSPLTIDLGTLDVGRYRFLSGDGRSLPL
nr:hypothetical protein [Flavobacteriales bacterium]